DMIKYFKEKWKEGDDIIEEDVIEEVCELEKNVSANEIVRKGKNVLNQP
ncbi:hypothetical protein Tco_0403117, partial [Tanacetum coccineum]